METKIKVGRMTCMHCVGAVTKALQSTPGVKHVEVSLQSGQAIVEGSADVAVLLKAVREEGYEAQLI